MDREVICSVEDWEEIDVVYNRIIRNNRRYLDRYVDIVIDRQGRCIIGILEEVCEDCDD